jgi:transcription antitermination factor NusG
MRETSIPNHNEWTDERIDNPVETLYKKGDKIRVKIGPAAGKAGTIEVERRGNLKAGRNLLATSQLVLKLMASAT